MKGLNWQAFLEESLENKYLSPVIISLLKQVTPVERGGDLVGECPNAGVTSFLTKNSAKIHKALHVVTGHEYHIIFHTQDAPVSSKKRVEDMPIMSFEPRFEDILHRYGIHPHYSFHSFAVSGSNNLAFAAASAVAKTPGKSYNPLFFWGGVGVGKSHLAHAIARSVLEKNPQAQVFCAPGDMFTNELIESIREKKTALFRKKFRKLNVFVIDDVQFIAGKEAVQEEFFHTFNSIVQGGGQVILTSDRPPHEIKNLEDRLRSRFSGGLMVDIRPPDFELRTAILLIKAKEKDIPLSMDGAKLIAEHITDTRALEGALLTLHARAFTSGGVITLDDIEEYFSEREPQPSTTIKAQRVAPQDIIRIVCSYYDVKQTHVKSSLRTDHIATVRQLIMYILRNHLHLTLESIASILKRKDHTTIIHGIQKIEQKITRDPLYKEEVHRIIQTLNLSK